METFTYLLIGGGMAADSALRGIRECDSSGTVALFSSEPIPPYDRPPLSKGLWMGTSEEEIWRKTEREAVSLFLGRTIRSIDPAQKIVTDLSGDQFGYEKLLIATGAAPRQLSECEGILYYRTLEDYHALRALYDRGNDFLVVGGGFIGTEIAAALAMNGKNVTLLFRQASLGARTLPKKFSQFLSAYFTEKGVRLLPEDTIAQATLHGEKFHTKTAKGQELFFDGVIAGVGACPRVELATDAGLKVEDGIVVDAFLKTSHPDIFAAGDVARFYNPLLNKNLRIEHEDAANSMGKQAGRNMAGACEEYTYLPYFYSDLFELGYEAVGELSADMEIVEEWEDLYRKGTLYYLREGKLLGAMMWGIWEQVDRIRELIASNTTTKAK